MKELSQSVRVVPVRDIPQDFSGLVSDLLPLSYHFHADPFRLEPHDVSGTGGECWELDMDHIIDNVSPGPFTNPLSSLVIYKLSGRDEYIVVGTPQLPATVQVVKGLNNCTLKVSCRMLHSPF